MHECVYLVAVEGDTWKAKWNRGKPGDYAIASSSPGAGYEC